MVAGAPAAQAATAPAAAVPARAAAASSVREVLGSGRKNAVALTIDDGPHPTWTPKVLDLLAASGVRATFSLVGSRRRATRSSLAPRRQPLPRLSVDDQPEPGSTDDSRGDG